MHSLIAGIYDAAVEPERWPGALSAIRDAVGARATTVAILDRNGATNRILAAGIPDDYVHRFVNEFGAPGTLIANLTQKMPVGSMCFVSLELGQEEWLASDIYQEMLRPFDIFHPGALILEKGPDYHVGISTLLDEDLQKFEENGKSRLDLLIPHLHRALSLSARLEGLGAMNRTLAEALDQVTSAGIVLFDATGSVVLANRTAEEIAFQHDGFAVKPSGVAAATLDQTKELERAIAAAAKATAGNGFAAGGAFRLARPSGRRPLLAIVSPVGAAEWELLPRRPAAILLICDPERKPELPGERLGQLFGLTCREAQIAALLAQGIELRDAAERLGISRGTAHTHLKRILEKTDTHRQAELVSLLMRGLAGLAHRRKH